MQIRSPGAPDEPSEDGSESFAAEDRVPVPRQSDGSIRFVVPTRVVAAKFAVAVVVLLIALFATNEPGMIIGLVAAAGLAVYAVRDLVARERLRADAEGLVAVRGFASRHRLAWNDVERVRVDARNRLGGRSQLLEVDAGDAIYLYSRFDLGVEPEDAVHALDEVRTG